MFGHLLLKSSLPAGSYFGRFPGANDYNEIEVIKYFGLLG